MGIGPITWEPSGPVTDPGGVRLEIGAGIVPLSRDVEIYDYTLPSFVHLPEFRGAMWADGVKPVRHVIEDTVFRSSILAPLTPLVPSAGVQATTVFDFDFLATGTAQQPPDNGWFVIVKRFVFVSTLLAGSLQDVIQVKIEATVAGSIQNLANAITGTATEGLDYRDDAGLLAAVRSTVEVTSFDAFRINLRVLAIGSGGNGVVAFLDTDLLLPFGTWLQDHGLGSNGQTVGTGGNFTGGGDNGESFPPGPGPGSFRWIWQHYRGLDAAESGRSPYAELLVEPAQDVLLQGFVLQNDPSTDYDRWYRTPAQGGIFRLGRAVAEFIVSDLDTFSDTELSGVGELLYDERAHRLYEDGYAPRVRWIARHRGRVFGGGADLSSDYVVGTAAVDVGVDAYKVTLSVGAVVTHDLEGRDFQQAGSAEWFRIVRCDPATNSFQLNRAWGVTNATFSYVISDAHARNTNELFWSESIKPTRWPPKNSLLSITTPNPRGITGMIEHQDALFVFTATGIWEVTPSAVTEFQARSRYEGVGCVGGHSIVAVEGILIFCGFDGIYSWGGSQAAPQKISNPANQGGPASGIQETWNRVNKAHVSEIVGHYDPERRLVRWFVPLDDDTSNRHVIVLDLQAQTWSLDTAEDIRSVHTVLDDTGDQVTLLGTMYGGILEADKGTVDDVFDEQLVHTVDASTTATVTVLPDPLWPTDAFLGAPCWLKTTDGDFVRATIVSNTTDTLLFAREIPALAWDQLYLGSISMQLETGRWNSEDPGRRKTFARVRVIHSVEAEGEYFVASAADSGALTVREITKGSLSEPDGETLYRAQRVGRSHAFGLYAFSADCEPEFIGYEIELIARDRPDA